jgi:hypothetical protein
MDETMQNDIRKLLKTFGVKADQAIHAYFENHPALNDIRIRLVLDDLNPNQATEALHLEVEGEVRRSS